MLYRPMDVEGFYGCLGIAFAYRLLKRGDACACLGGGYELSHSVCAFCVGYVNAFAFAVGGYLLGAYLLI